MSSWIVSKGHIDAVVTVARQYATPEAMAQLDPEERALLRRAIDEPTALGHALWKVNHDTNNPEAPGPGDDADTWADFKEQFYELPGLRSYEFEEFPGRARPAVAFKVVGCYRYQTEASDEWDENRWPERIFIEALARLIEASAPGVELWKTADYQAAPWSEIGNDVFLRPPPDPDDRPFD